MLNRTTLKRIFTTGLATCIVAGLLASVGTSMAASAYYIRFYDSTSGKESENTTIVEGSSINIRATLPPQYAFSEKTPFAVRQSGVGPIADASSVFDIKKNSDKNYTLIAKDKSAHGSSSEYILNAIYTAIIGQGSGIATYSDVPNKVFEQFALRVEAEPALSITEDSSISFTARTDENAYGMLDFGPVKATNSLADYDGGSIRSGAIITEGRDRYINIDIPSTNKDNPTPLKLRAYLLNLPSSYRIKKDTYFELSFLRQTINSMILTVITPQKAVDDTIASVRENPTTPEATDIGKPYISLVNGETLTSIKSNFTMLRQVHRHNIDVNLLWKWVPDDAKYDNIVQLRNPTPSTTSFEIIDRPKEDVSGALEVTATYDKVLSTTIKIPILIYGTGVPPTVKPLKKLTGNPNPPAGETNPMEETITALPKQMDVYRGDANYTFYKAKPRGPYQYRVAVDFGTGRGMAQSMVISYLGDGGQADIKIDGASTLYTPGTKIINPGTTTNIEITAMQAGQIRLQFEFYDAKGLPMRTDWVNWSTEVFDSRPSTDGTLKSLDLNVLANTPADQTILEEIYPRPKGVVDYGFAPKTNGYLITVPYKASRIKLTPRLPAGTGANGIVLSYDGAEHPINSGATSAEIALDEMRTKNVLVRVTAEDGSTNSYTLAITRASRDTNAQLQFFSAKAAQPGAVELIQNFSPTVYEYNVSVPYATDKATLTGITSSAWASAVFDPTGAEIGTISKTHTFTVPKLNLTYDPITGVTSNNITTVLLRVTAEDGSSTNDYRVHITREAPNDNRNLKLLNVLDAAGKEISFDGEKKFQPGDPDYAISIPYSTKSLTVNAQPEEALSGKVTLTLPTIFAAAPVEKEYHGIAPVTFKNLDVSQDPVHNPAKDIFTIQVQATAESGRMTTPPYAIEVTRQPPSSDNALTALDVTDDAGKVPVPDYAFRTQTLAYDIAVPYLMKTVRLTPKASSPLSTVVIDGEPVTTRQPYVLVDLAVNSVKAVNVVVTAENGDVRTYVLRLKRQSPSKEARLADLQVDKHALDRKFVPSVTEYKVILPDTVQSYSITPTAIDPFATITVDGKTIASGAATSLITPDKPQTQVQIIVTAQDGNTKMTYTLTILAEALVPKGSNADLKSLDVKVAQLSPRFKPSVWSYDVAVSGATRAIDILPVAADPFATIKVLAGSKVLGDYNGNFSTALPSDKTDIKVEVTAHDGTTKRTYDLAVYRDTDGKNGKYEPVTADMIDFETNDPIIVDISNNPVIAADVFNTMKEKYPQKTIIFKGNDYSLECKGSDIKQTVPITQTFNFSMSFSSPEEGAIRAWLDAHGNAGLNPVYVYFEHHGPLPAAMKLTLSLGAAYGNQTLHWNYYNTERDRMDYYGDVSSNGQGTFSLLMSHASTYLPTRQAINGAENKVGLESGVGAGNLSSGVTSGKQNPTTAAKGDSE